MEEALAGLDEAMDRCLSVLLSARTSEELVGYLDRLQTHQQRLAAMQAALVRELEVLEVPRRHGATSTMAWPRTRYRISPGAAKRLASMAQTTADRLCGHHHRLIHHSAWQVHIKNGRPVFTPPPDG